MSFLPPKEEVQRCSWVRGGSAARPRACSSGLGRCPWSEDAPDRDEPDDILSVSSTLLGWRGFAVSGVGMELEAQYDYAPSSRALSHLPFVIRRTGWWRS